MGRHSRKRWEESWEILCYPLEIRKIIYTMNIVDERLCNILTIL